MQIIVDKGQKVDKHIQKHNDLIQQGYELMYCPLPVGDYIASNAKVADVMLRKLKRNTAVKKMDLLGTYTVCVDTKRDIQELIGNVAGKSHARFRDEVLLAKNNGIKLYVLIENLDNVNSLTDLLSWKNPRADKMVWKTDANGKRVKVPLSKNATSGETLCKILLTMQEKYGVSFVFCNNKDTAKTIIELLR